MNFSMRKGYAPEPLDSLGESVFWKVGNKASIWTQSILIRFWDFWLHSSQTRFTNLLGRLQTSLSNIKKNISLGSGNTSVCLYLCLHIFAYWGRIHASVVIFQILEFVTAVYVCLHTLGLCDHHCGRFKAIIMCLFTHISPSGLPQGIFFPSDSVSLKRCSHWHQNNTTRIHPLSFLAHHCS